MKHMKREWKVSKSSITFSYVFHLSKIIWYYWESTKSKIKDNLYAYYSVISMVYFFQSFFISIALISYLQNYYRATQLALVVKNKTKQKEKTACQCKTYKRLGFHRWVGKISWRRKWPLTPIFFPGEFHGKWSLAGYSS